MGRGPGLHPRIPSPHHTNQEASRQNLKFKTPYTVRTHIIYKQEVLTGPVSLTRPLWTWHLPGGVRSHWRALIREVT